MNDKYPALEKAREKNRQLRAAGIKPVILTPPEKAACQPGSLRLAIDAHCWGCVGGEHDPGPKHRVRDCQIRACSLWMVRPWQKLKDRSNASMDDEEDAS